MLRVISVILTIIQFCTISFAGLFGRHMILIDTSKTYQTFEDFGTSSCWWAQTISDEAEAEKIAKLLYSEKDGLGLKIFRYNIGGGEADNPQSRIGDPARRTESFYVFNTEKQAYEYDFTRDANARRMLDYAVKYGAEKIILFCNSPHFSMTKSGHASGGLTEYSSNLPKENYPLFVDYLLTVADWFVSQGYPVYAISPINEPQWSWGGAWVIQEGCHFEPDEAIELLEMFAVEMKKRNSPYRLSCPESGEMSWKHYEYVKKFFASEILCDFCDSFSGHSYWMDSKSMEKQQIGAKFKADYPNKKYEMSEWCELPLSLDSNGIDSGLLMARIIIDDLTKMNAVSWQSWTAVNGDGLLDRGNGEFIPYTRYYAFKHFSSFIKNGMVRVRIFDNLSMQSVAFAGEGENVIVLVNSEAEAEQIKLCGLSGKAEIFVTDESRKCERIYDGEIPNGIEIPSKSIVTIRITY